MFSSQDKNKVFYYFCQIKTSSYKEHDDLCNRNIDTEENDQVTKQEERPRTRNRVIYGMFLDASNLIYHQFEPKDLFPQPLNNVFYQF